MQLSTSPKSRGFLCQNILLSIFFKIFEFQDAGLINDFEKKEEERVTSFAD